MPAEDSQQEKQLVTFKLGEEEYGIEISHVREIIKASQITPVPRAPQFVEGVINLRGKIVPVIDLKKRLGLPQGKPPSQPCIIVLEMKGQLFGVKVDAVAEVLKLPGSAIEPPPQLVGIAEQPEQECLTGVGKMEDRLILLIDVDKVLSPEQLGQLGEA